MFHHIIKSIAILTIFFSITSCGEDKAKRARVGDENFSITQFLDDQWAILNGQPYTLTRIETGDGKTDTAFVELNEKVWNEIRSSFDATDISDSSFKDKYKFEIVEDPENGLVNLSYTANSEDEFTQKLIVVMDGFNHKVKTMHVETRDDGTFSYKSQKLSYIPYRSIIVQRYDKSFLSSEEETKVLYKFPSKYD